MATWMIRAKPWYGLFSKKEAPVQIGYTGGCTHIWEWRVCADATPKVVVFRWQTKQREKGVFQWGKEKNRGSFGDDYKKEGIF